MGMVAPNRLSSSRGSRTLFWPLWAPIMHLVQRLTCRQNIHTHKNNTNKVNFSKEWAGKMAQWVRMFAARSGDLGSFPETPTVEGEN